MLYEANALHFTGVDGEVIYRCGITWTEMQKGHSVKTGLPPLWSPLAYVMLFYSGLRVGEFWKEYRHLQRILAKPDDHYRSMTMHETGKKPRKLSVPDFELRRHQEFILHNILSRVQFPSCVTAYRKGCSIRNCAAPHLHAKVLVHLDIRDFFGSITREMVEEALEKQLGFPDSVVKLLADLCCCRGVLPQGAPTSPALSNLVFRPCDKMLMTLAEANGLTYTRYADDLFFSGSVENIPFLIQRIRLRLLMNGFRLNDDKISVMRSGRAKKVMGLTVEDKVQVERAYRRKLRQEIHYVERFGKDAAGVKAAGSYYTYLHSLQGKVGYVLSVSPEDREFQAAAQTVKRLIDRDL